MSNTREIVTLQFGHYSNFIGTHFWNLQELGFDYTGNCPTGINHDILYREGHNLKNEVTYTPRLLLADLKGSLKQLPIYGELYDLPYESEGSTSKDDTNVEIITEPTTKKNPFQTNLNDPEETIELYNLDDDVHVWSDFLYSRFHPRTVNIVKEYHHENQANLYDSFYKGCSTWKSHFEEDFTDKIRNYTEECNSLQGFHVILDSINGFAGLANECLQCLQDEYESKAVLAFPVLPSYYEDYNYSNTLEQEQSAYKDSIRLLNLTLCMRGLSNTTSLFVPLSAGSKGWRQPGPPRSFKHINFNHQLAYHSSAILAAAIDTSTLRYRLSSNSFLPGLCGDLNSRGCKAAAASLNFPFSIREQQDLIDCLDQWQGPLWESITPNCKISTERALQIVTLRGISETQLKQPLHNAKHQREMAAYKCQTVKEMLSLYLACNSYATPTDVVTTSSPLITKTPFPKIFDKNINYQGLVSNLTRSNDEIVKSVPLLAGLHSGTGLGEMFQSLHDDASKLKIKKFNSFQQYGLDTDEYAEILNEILNLRECYEDNFV